MLMEEMEKKRKLNEHMEVADDDSDSEVFGNAELEESDLQGGGGGGTR